MSFPFRRPINTEDSPSDNWEPPDYATPISAKSSDEEWSPPDYATPIGEKKKSPGLLSRFIEAATHPKPFKAGTSKFDTAVRTVSEPITEAPSRFAEKVSEYINPRRETKGLRGIGSAYIESLGRTISGLTSPLNLALTASGAGEAAGIRGASAATKALSAPIVAEGLKNIYEGKDISEKLLGGVEAATGALGLRSRGIKVPEELSIRRPAISREIPYRSGEPTNLSNFETRPTNIAMDASKMSRASLEKLNKFMDSTKDITPEEAQSMIRQPISEESRRALSPEEISKEEVKKPSFVNPFKKEIEEASPISRQVATDTAEEMARKRGTPGDVPDNPLAKRIEAERKAAEGWKPPDYATVITTGGSGESTASMEAINRQASMKGKKEQYVVYNRAGEMRPLIGPEAVDYSPKKGETYGIQSSEGFKQLEDNGGKVPSSAKTPDVLPAKESAGKYYISEKTYGTPESLHPQLTGLKNYGDGVLYLDFDKSKPINLKDVEDLFPNMNVSATELHTSENLPSRFRVDIQGEDPARSGQLGNEIEKSVGGSFDDTTELHGGLGGVGGFAEPPLPNKGPAGAALDKLFNSLGKTTEQRVKQDIINKSERAKRFATFASVKEEGVAGAKKSLSTLKGEFEKVDPERLLLSPKEADTLFTTVKRANITEGEKARGYTALFKLLNGESIPQRNELAILDNVFGNGFANRVIEMHGGIGAVGIRVSKLMNTMKSMQNSISLAAPLRHGIGLVARKEFYPAFADMFRFFGNKEYYNTAMQALEERPNYLLGREAGLAPIRVGSLANSEEEFLNSYAGNIPIARNVVGASQRAYMGFLSKLRADTFDSMIKQAEGLGYKSHTMEETSIIPSKTTEAIANYINNATGRGSLGRLNSMTNELNMLLWSPRMIASRITMLTNPKLYLDLPKGMRMEGLKSLLGIAALGTAIDTLSAYAGAKVSTNILSTDFGKSRFGTKLIDPWGGFQQYIVGAARFLSGKTDSPQPTSRLDIAGRFIANKESPAASLAHSILTAKKFTPTEGPGTFTTEYGQKTSIQSEIGKRFAPIFTQDLYDLAASEPDFANNVGLDTAMGMASLAGMSQNYPEKKGRLGLRKMRLR